MITYEYLLYKNKKTKHIDNILKEACFIWNHCLSLQKKYYKLYKKYINKFRLINHITKYYKTSYIGSQSRQEIIERLDTTYQRFFKKIGGRPKYKKSKHFTSFLFKGSVGYKLVDNIFTLNKAQSSRNRNYQFKFSKSREYEGNIKTVRIKRDKLGKYWLYIVTDKDIKGQFINRKTRNGEPIGIDFGLNTYLTISKLHNNNVFSIEEIRNPQYLKRSLNELRDLSRKHSLAKKNSKKREKLRIRLVKLYQRISNLRDDYQWKLSHYLCNNYHSIYIENLDLRQFTKTKYWGRKINDLAHGEFLLKLKHVASKYDVSVHKIERYYPSSKTCGSCNYVNKSLTIGDRSWTCPNCNEFHSNRDFLAATNILRKGIYELEGIVI